MIRATIDGAYSDALDERETKGKALIIQIGPLLLQFWLTWGRK